ncbi:MAG: MotA/TolQ/ExbB proton channel family protein [Calditrichaeota bacterium]|nr:MotA/TolQ/ExbB proton channel family protein [Calditrichota bacterium]HQU71028.1 MotA/TolQ/ExbB proton channel family protein [Calditrichia bacterium]
MLELFAKGGIMMYPLAICSVVALGVALERMVSLRKNKIVIPELVGIIPKIHSAEDLRLLHSVCESRKDPMAGVLMSCLRNRDLPLDELRATVEDEGRQQVRSLNFGLNILETIAGIAPLLGLLGTVIGMIDVFEVIQSIGVGQAQKLSGGISEALITTAAGLFVGIPALIAFNYFTSRSESLILDIEKHALNLLNAIVRMRTNSNENVDLNLRTS